MSCATSARSLLLLQCVQLSLQILKLILYLLHLRGCRSRGVGLVNALHHEGVRLIDIQDSALDHQRAIPVEDNHGLRGLHRRLHIRL